MSIVFSDLHLKTDTENLVFDEVLPGILEAALKTTSKEIIFLGDWYDVRNSVLIRLQNRTLEWLVNGLAQGVTFRLLPGNHDQCQADGSNALEVFGGIPGITVYSKPTLDSYGMWVPYGFDLPETQHRVVWAHADVAGGMMNSSKMSENGWELESLSDKFVISGHYHKRQTVRNNGVLGAIVNYVGSPYQTNAGESGNECGYHVWDGVKRELTFIAKNWGPKYHKLDLQSGEFSIPSNMHPRDRIQVTAPSKDLDSIYRRFSDAGFNDVKITPTSEVKESRLNVSDTGNLGDYVVSYVQQFKGDLPEDDLLKAFLECRKAVDGG